MSTDRARELRRAWAMLAVIVVIIIVGLVALYRRQEAANDARRRSCHTAVVARRNFRELLRAQYAGDELDAALRSFPPLRCDTDGAAVPR